MQAPVVGSARRGEQARIELLRPGKRRPGGVAAAEALERTPHLVMGRRKTLEGGNRRAERYEGGFRVPAVELAYPHRSPDPGFLLRLLAKPETFGFGQVFRGLGGIPAGLQ